MALKEGWRDRFFVDSATRCARESVVFGRPIGKNGGIKFPIARAYTRVESAALTVEKAATLFFNLPRVF